MGFKQHISRTWQMIEQQVNDVPFRPGNEAESELTSSAGAKVVLEREKRHRGAAPRTRRMQRNANLNHRTKRKDSRGVAEAE